MTQKLEKEAHQEKIRKEEARRLYIEEHGETVNLHEVDWDKLEYYYDDEEEEEEPEKAEEQGKWKLNHWGVAQNMGQESEERIQEILQSADTYMTDTVYNEVELRRSVFNCENQYADCAVWAAQGT